MSEDHLYRDLINEFGWLWFIWTYIKESVRPSTWREAWQRAKDSHE